MLEDDLQDENDEAQHFQVNIVILEGRHLSIMNADTKVVIRVGGRRKTFKSKTAKTDSPYFNEFCIFNFYLPLGALLDQIIVVTLYGSAKLRRNRLIGSFTVELATIWAQPNHQFYHKWATLTDPNNPAEGVKGYLKCDIGVLSRGSKAMPADMDRAEKIEDHLMVPYGEVNDRQKAKFVFSVFRADNFTTQPFGSLYSYVKITYAGMTGKTSVANNTLTPVWNEELAFVEMIPALCQHVHIEICDAYKTIDSGTIGFANLDLRKLSHESEIGFLPTYGPSFIYLYQNLNKTATHTNCSYATNSFTYVCRLLLALRTEIVDYAEDVLARKIDPKIVKPKTIPRLDETRYFNYKEFIFFAAVLDILLFDQKFLTSRVNIRINMGPEKLRPGTKTAKIRKRLRTRKEEANMDQDKKDDDEKFQKRVTWTSDKSEMQLPRLNSPPPPPPPLEPYTSPVCKKRSKRLGYWPETWPKFMKQDINMKLKVDDRLKRWREKSSDGEPRKKRKPKKFLREYRPTLRGRKHKKRCRGSDVSRRHDSSSKTATEDDFSDTTSRSTEWRTSRTSINSKLPLLTESKLLNSLRAWPSDWRWNTDEEFIHRKERLKSKIRSKSTQKMILKNWKTHHRRRDKHDTDKSSTEKSRISRLSEKFELMREDSGLKNWSFCSHMYHMPKRSATSEHSRSSSSSTTWSKSSLKMYINRKKLKNLRSWPKDWPRKRRRTRHVSWSETVSEKPSKLDITTAINSSEYIVPRNDSIDEDERSIKNVVRLNRKSDLTIYPRKYNFDEDEDDEDINGEESDNNLDEKDMESPSFDEIEPNGSSIIDETDTKKSKTSSSTSHTKKNKREKVVVPHTMERNPDDGQFLFKSSETSIVSGHQEAEFISEDEMEEALDSAKTKKRFWNEKKRKKRDVYSPHNSTEKNLEIYFTLMNEKPNQNSQTETTRWKFWKKKNTKSDPKIKDDDIDEGIGEDVDGQLTNERSEESRLDMDDDSTELTDKESVKQVRIFTGCNSTPPILIKVKERYGYSGFYGTFPCVHLVGEWPNQLRKMYRSNVIKRSLQKLKDDLVEVDSKIKIDEQIEASYKIKETLQKLHTECGEILKWTEKIEKEDTNVQRERRKYYHREIKQMMMEIQTTVEKNILLPEEELKRANGYLKTLRRYADDPEDSFPDTEITLLRDGIKVGQYRLRTQNVVFSPHEEQRGLLSGKSQSIIIRDKLGDIIAKVEMFMWFGLGDHFDKCLDMLPAGYHDNRHVCSGTDIENIPMKLSYDEVHNFECRVYLFQGRLSATDENGLADPYVRVTILNQYKQTAIKRETITPTWDEMVVFPKVSLYGNTKFIKTNSVTITIEVFDHDYLSSPELIGRLLYKPTVWLKDDSYKAPELEWENIKKDCVETGSLLMNAELLEVGDVIAEEKEMVSIPMDVRPVLTGHRLEVLFWGIRELKRKVSASSKIYVTLECGGKSITSPILKNANRTHNFPWNVQTIDLDLPEEHLYKPPIVLKLNLSTPYTIGRDGIIGNCIIPSVKVFFCETANYEQIKQKEIASMEMLKQLKLQQQQKDEEERVKALQAKQKSLLYKIKEFFETILAGLTNFYKNIKCRFTKSCSNIDREYLEELKETMDWWVKYYASKENQRDSIIDKLVVYEDELEAQPQFREFSDFLYTFNIVTGKVKKKVRKQVLVAKLKAAIKLYKWPLDSDSNRTYYGVDIAHGILNQLPYKNEAIKYVARVYIVACRNLTPKDIYGKSDPYLFLQVGRQKVKDRIHYIPKQVNPIFGKCFEFHGIFPKEHLLNIKVMDHDVVTQDDLIGETSIDLENRYYTKHHASCGISQSYTRSGVNAWRDAFRPSEILQTVCKQSNMEKPMYTDKGVSIEGYNFRSSDDGDQKYQMEQDALEALKNWHDIPVRGYQIVPEHVETRPLYHPSYPGVEQGKIEMWVDIFPADFRYIPKIVDIEPKKPVAMELRAIVWNVEGVILSDTSFLFNEKMSDIYVRGWLNSIEEDTQETDVHYRSMNGEGNFNWRFVFPFNYIQTERRLVIYRKQHPLDPEPEELKFPCRLELQVWDNDFFADDFLGSLNLELNSIPRGAKISTTCKLSMLDENEIRDRIDLFKIRRTRGWWPFRKLIDEESTRYEMTGKVDLELEIVTQEEANQSPVGKGREEPKALPEPKRPASSFIWFLNPLKTFRFIILRKYAKHLIIILIVVMVVAFVLLGIYAFPGYVVKRMVGA